MMHNRFTKITILILVICISIPAYPMLILKQEKKHSPAHFFIQDRKINDPCISQELKRNGGSENIIIWGGGLIGCFTGAPLPILGGTILFGIANAATEIATGRSLIDRWRGKNKGINVFNSPQFKDLIESKRYYDNLDQYEVREVEYFPRRYDGKPSYMIIPDVNHERGYRFAPYYDEDIQLTSIIFKPAEMELPKGCFAKEEHEFSITECFPRPENNNVAKGCFEEREKQPNAQGCFNENDITKTPLTHHYVGQIKPGDVFFPEIPRREDGFRPAKEKGGKITKKVAPNGQYGYEDKRGYWWIPCGKNDTAHGGEQWDLLDRWGKKVDDVFPGGNNKSGERSPYILKCSTLIPGTIRVADYENNLADKIWLEEFAKKICPSGGYQVGEIIISPEKSEGHDITIIDETTIEKTTSYQKVPVYSSGNRLANWEKTHKKPIVVESVFEEKIPSQVDNAATIKVKDTTGKQDEQKSSTVNVSSPPAILIPPQVANVIPQEPSVTYGPSPASRLLNALSESYNSGIIARLLAISSVNDSLHRTSTSLSLEERISDSRSKPVFNNPDSANYSPFRPSSSSQFPFHGGQREL